jgi:dienelactone hydrolase
MGWQANKELIEALSAKRPGVNYREEQVPAYVLPELLTMADGRPIRQAEDWPARRAELLELFREQVYGRSPAAPAAMRFETVEIDPQAMEGMATLKRVHIHFSDAPEAPVLRLTMFVPNRRQGPAPAFLLICNRGVENIDPTRKIRRDFWPAERIVERGYIAAAFFNGDVAVDKYDGFSGGIHALLQRPEERLPSSWGTLAAWAWGAARVMDYWESDADVDTSRCVVTGHSRGGKTALWAAAEDSRFAMAVSNESGCGGAALSRRCYGETLSIINRAMPHWFCSRFHDYNGREEALPIDQHQLIALIAPRAAYISSADQDLWADPRGEFLAAQAASPAYELLGRGGLGKNSAMPGLNEPLLGDGLAYHIREGEHTYSLYDWECHMDMADREFK